MKPNTPQSRLRAVKPAEKPIGGLMDPRFVYVRAAETDIRKTFARIREHHLLKGKQ